MDNRYRLDLLGLFVLEILYGWFGYKLYSLKYVVEETVKCEYTNSRRNVIVKCVLQVDVCFMWLFEE